MKVLTAFCTKPGADQDKSRSGKRRSRLDLSDFARSPISITGSPCDDAVAKEVFQGPAKRAAISPNDSDWAQARQPRPGATERILEIIRDGIAAGKGATPRSCLKETAGALRNQIRS